MTAIVTTAFWSMTVNNPDETTLALVRNGYPDYCREIIYTLEQGEEGTPHIQAWLKLQRQQRLSFVKKLFPRGHFKPLTNAEYVHNTKMYAQKDDETTRSAHHHIFHDPTGTLESIMKKVIHQIISEYGEDETDLNDARRWVEQDLVRSDYKLAKIFVSATYKQMWKQFGHEMYECIFQETQRINEEARVEIPVLDGGHTHTHTHGDEKFSVAEDITSEDGEGNFEEGSTHSSESDYGEEGESDEDSQSETSEGDY